MHLRTRILIAASALVLSACGDRGVLVEENVSSTSAALVDFDGTWTLSWNVYPGPNQGGYAQLAQRFNGGAWTTIYYTGLGQQSHTVTATQYGVYDYKVNYWWMPQSPCGGHYCFNPGLSQGSLTLQSVQFLNTGGQGGGAGASGAGGAAGNAGSAAGGAAGNGASAGQGGMSGGTAGTGGTGECGNGVPEPPEECDDGNFTSGDGCEPDCTTTG
jgi:cysteine-rich repeat protein